ncbi:MAG TPA: thymidylate synthase [Pyrinomonadaceae bacterium]
MTQLYTGETADQVWRAAASELRQSEAADLQPGRGGATREQLHAVFSISNPRQRWVVSRRPPINPAFAIAEVVWILNGRNDAGFVNHWNPNLPKFAGEVDCYHGAYGFRLRKEFGFDQLERAYHALQNNPDSRQVVLQIWNPMSDFPDTGGVPVAADIPCNICALPKLRNNKLEWLQVMRSNDLQRGLPYNFVQFTCLQEVMAGWLGVEVGTYSHVSDSLHTYERDIADVQSFTQVEEEANTDTLALSRSESVEVLAEMSRLMDAIASPSLSQKDMRSLVSSHALPQGYRNMLLVTAADSARRRDWPEITNELMAECNNPAFVQTWNSWTMRRKEKSG